MQVGRIHLRGQKCLGGFHLAGHDLEFLEEGRCVAHGCDERKFVDDALQSGKYGDR